MGRKRLNATRVLITRAARARRKIGRKRGLFNPSDKPGKEKREKGREESLSHYPSTLSKLRASADSSFLLLRLLFLFPASLFLSPVYTPSNKRAVRYNGARVYFAYLRAERG